MAHSIELDEAAAKVVGNHTRPAPVNPGVANTNLWRLLHEFAKTCKDPEEQKQFVQQWEANLPSSCGCAEKWIAINFQFNYGEGFLKSTIEAHDIVARQLYAQGKQDHLASIEDMLRVWEGPRVGFFAISHMNIGGAEIWAETLLPALRHLINIEGFACFDKTLEKGNPAKLKVPYYYDPEALIQKCDIIVSWGTPSIVQHGKPTVSINHTDLNSGWNPAMLAFGDVQVAVNPACAGVYIPNVIDPKRAAPHRAPIKNTVLWGHRFSEEKNPKMLLEIAKLMPDYQFTMVGDSWLFEECKALAPINVTMLGARDSLAEALSTTESFISLSVFEGFGLSVGEAMLSKVPVISTPTGLCTEEVATIVNLTDPLSAWVDAIRKPKDTVQAAYSLAKTFSLERATSKWSSLLWDLWDSQK